jgi:hypothetical protein
MVEHNIHCKEGRNGDKLVDTRVEEFVGRVLDRIDLEHLLFCDCKDCPERGEYIICYYDKYPDCGIYREMHES